jgi:hypothetical protein
MDIDVPSGGSEWLGTLTYGWGVGASTVDAPSLIKRRNANGLSPTED